MQCVCVCFFYTGGGAELVWSGSGPLRGWIFFFPSGARLSLEANEANADAAGAEQQGKPQTLRVSSQVSWKNLLVAPFSGLVLRTFRLSGRFLFVCA